MKNITPKTIARTALFLGGLILLSHSSIAQTSSDFDPTLVRGKLEEIVNPIYPRSLSDMGTFEGSATILIELDENGKMTDWLPLSATHMEFVDAIANVINQWTFSPASRNGEAIPDAFSLTIRFKNEGVITGYNGMQMAGAFLNSCRNPSEEALVAQYSQLDKIPTPTMIVQPNVSGIEETERAGKVTLGFFIDENGKVRMPVLLNCEGDIGLAYAAHAALTQWTFEKPTVKGKAVTVRASQQFIFKADKEK